VIVVGLLVLIACQALASESESDRGFLEAELEAVSTFGDTNCLTVPCNNNGTCANGVCVCPNGFSGQMCEVDACAGVVCPNGGTCSKGQCSVDPCAKVFCQNGGTCLNGICACANNFTGAFCQQHPCENVKCINEGICKPPGVCQCLNGFKGQFCELNPCSTVQCLNNGKCLYGQCICMPEWSGKFCQRPSEAARDYKIYSDRLEDIAKKVSSVARRMRVIRNVTSPESISAGLASLVREVQVSVVEKAKEDSKRNFMTPRVIGIKPVTHKDMRVKNTEYENARIYEDRDLAYQKAREVKDVKLRSAMGEVEKYDQQRKIDAVVLAKDVPGAEYFKGPFGGFAEVEEKYVPPDASLLEADLDAYRKDESMMRDLIYNAP